MRISLLKYWDESSHNSPDLISISPIFCTYNKVIKLLPYHFVTINTVAYNCVLNVFLFNIIIFTTSG